MAAKNYRGLFRGPLGKSVARRISDDKQNEDDIGGHNGNNLIAPRGPHTTTRIRSELGVMNGVMG